MPVIKAKSIIADKLRAALLLRIVVIRRPFSSGSISSSMTMSLCSILCSDATAWSRVVYVESSEVPSSFSSICSIFAWNKLTVFFVEWKELIQNRRFQEWLIFSYSVLFCVLRRKLSPCHPVSQYSEIYSTTNKVGLQTRKYFCRKVEGSATVLNCGSAHIITEKFQRRE